MFDDLRERATEYYEEPEPEPSNALADFVEVFDPQQRFILAMLLLFNVVIIGCMCLAAFGRIQF